MTIPLTQLTPWVWTSDCVEAFRLLKTAFMTAPILHHFNPNLPPIVKTDMSDYAIAGILSMCTNNNNVHPVTFYSRTLSGSELNYNTHNKELLAIFEAFKTWRHYLESLHHAIDIITNHKNLEYFVTMKTLTRCQACWSEYLLAFNMVIQFRPGRLSEKLDSLTQHADYYLKGGDRDFALVNPQNLCPIFSQEQLSALLCATHLQEVASDAAVLVDSSIPLLDTATLVDDIKISLTINPLAECKLDHCVANNPSPCFLLAPTGLLLLDCHIYVPDYQPDQGNLCT